MIVSLKRTHSPQVAKIHQKALAGDFLPSLGFAFLKTFYEGIIGKPGVYGFAYEEDEKILGFVVGTSDSKIFFSQALRARFIKLSFLLLIQLIKRPQIIKNILETFFYPKKDTGPKAELFVIAVDRKFQGKGVGRELVEALENAFRKDGINRYKLAVYANKKAVGFYEHLGYSRISNFRLYGKMWYVYAKEITRRKRKLSP